MMNLNYTIKLGEDYSELKRFSTNDLNKIIYTKYQPAYVAGQLYNPPTKLICMEGHTLLEECKKRGVKIDAPHLNEGVYYILLKRNGTETYQVKRVTYSLKTLASFEKQEKHKSLLGL